MSLPDQAELPVSPKLEALLKALSGIATPGINHDELWRHAMAVHVDAIHLAANIGVGASKIGGDRKRGFFAKRIASKGKSYEIGRLRRAAASGSLSRWLAAWAATSISTRDLIVSKLAERPSRGIPADWVSFSAPGYVINAPPARAARTAIAMVERDIRAIPLEHRRARKKDPFTIDFITTARAAFVAVTGRQSGLTWTAYGDRYSGKFLDLIKSIDAIYGTSIVPKRTPTRLRADGK